MYYALWKTVNVPTFMASTVYEKFYEAQYLQNNILPKSSPTETVVGSGIYLP